jgi:tetratricopeptide (TPR) repeat protein
VLDVIGLIASPFISFFKWITLDLRVARRVSKSASAEGIYIKPRALGRYFEEAGLPDALTTDDGRARARASLVALTGGDEDRASRLFDLLDIETTKRSSPVIATMSSGALVREDIGALQDAVEAATDDRALWDSRLASMKPIRAITAREANEVWPKMPMLLRLIDRGERKNILRSWALQLPGVLGDAPADVLAWLADVASDAGLDDAALAFLSEGLRRGAHPRGYWEFRRLRLETELQPGSPSEPRDSQYPLIMARDLELAGRLDEALEVIEAWQPSSIRERTTRTVMLAQVALNSRDYDAALELALPVHAETGNPASALLAARAMIARQTFGASELHPDDLADAFRLLISTRDDLRRWGENSTEVVALAVSAARLLNDPGRALRLTEAEPEGEATAAEAASIDLRVVRASMLADNGVLDEATALLSEGALDAATSAQFRALIADAKGDFEAAAAYYSEALDRTEDYEQKGQFAVRLAHLGTLHSFIDEQRQAGNEDYADQLTLIAEAFGDVDGGLDRLKAAAHSSAQLSLTLSQVYEARGEEELQLKTLRSSAARLGDADTWLVTARLEKSMGRVSDAIGSAKEALNLAPDGWGAFARTHGLLIELYSIVGDWDRAARSAKHLVRLLPGDLNAVWTLITCQHHAGELDAAFQTWDSLSDRRRPAHRSHVLVWLSLHHQFGEAVASLEGLRDAATEWAQDEEIRRKIVGLVILPNQAQSLGSSDTPDDVNSTPDAARTEETAEADEVPPSISAALIQEYFRDFPDGEMRQLTLNLEDESSILDQLVEAIGTRPDTSELDDQVFRGAFPVGLICLAHGATLTEAVISHASGVRFASSDSPDEYLRAQTQMGRSVVVDITALFALSVLPANLRAPLMGAFSGLSIAADQFRDAVSASQAIGRFGNAGPALGRLRGPVAQRSRPESHRILDGPRVRDLVELIRPLDRAARPADQTDSDRSAFADDVWFAAADVASDSRALWCDDAALNRIAGELGITTFSTVAVVKALSSLGELDQQQADAIAERLLVERYVGFPYESGIYHRAMAVGDDRAFAVASVIEHLGGHAANEVMDFAIEVAGSLTANGPRLEAWISACTRWLIRVSPDLASQRDNLRVLANRLTSVHWFLPQTFPFVDGGLRDGLDDIANVDPMVEAVGRLYLSRKQRNERLAALWLFELIAGVEAAARPRLTALAFRN